MADQSTKLKDLKLKDKETAALRAVTDEKDDDADTIRPAPKEQEEPDPPLELGGFLTFVPNYQYHERSSSSSSSSSPSSSTDDYNTPHSPTTTTTTEILARDTELGQGILFESRPCEIVGRKDSRAPSGAVASRHKVALELVELFDKEAVGAGVGPALVVKATERLERVEVRRERWCLVCGYPSFCFLVFDFFSGFHFYG